MPFLDIYMPDQISGYGWVSSPRWQTRINASASGKENRNQEWEHPLHYFINPEIISRPNQQSLIDLKKHWLITAGPFHSFPLADPHDMASIDHLPNELVSEITADLSSTDQPLGTADGFTDSFQLVKRYSRGGQNYDRKIYHPVLSTVLIADNGSLVSASDYTVSRTTGIVTFDTPPTNGHVLTAGFMFDVEVRFESDDQLEQIVRTWQAGGAADLNLVEVRPC